MSRALKDGAFRAIAQVGKAVAHHHRLELLHLLDQSPGDVDALSKGTERSIASTSQHLQVLARARLVIRQRQGTRIIYSLAPGATQLLTILENVALERNPALRQLQKDWLHDHPAVDLISDEDLGVRLEKGSAILIDVRPEAEFSHGHYPRARSVPLAQLHARLDELPRNQLIVAVCRGRWCTWADEAVELLRFEGFDARRLDG